MKSLVLDIAAKLIVGIVICALGFCQLVDWIGDIRKPPHAG